MMLLFRRRKKIPQPLTAEEARLIVKDELSLYETDRKKLDDEEKSKQLKMRKVMDMPPRKRLKFLRYLRQKGERHE